VKDAFLLAGIGALALLAMRKNTSDVNDTMTQKVLSDVMSTNDSQFNQMTVFQANIAQRAIDEGWSSERTLAALQPGYIDPTIVPGRATIENATREQLINQIHQLVYRGATQDMSHALAIQGYLDGVTSSIVPWNYGGSGSVGLENERAYPRVFLTSIHY